MKVLLLEDDLALNDIVSEHLTDRGFDVTVAFSGDEALMFTGYYATWNTLITMNGIADGVEEAAMDAFPNAPTMAAVVDSVIEWTTYYWEFDDASVATLKAAPVDAQGTSFRDAAIAQVTAWATAGLSFEQIGGALLPFIQGAVTNVQAALTAAGTPLLYYDDTPIIVDDSGHDLSMIDFDLAEAMEYGVLWNNKGGRVKAQSYANCFPAKWTQRVNSHWTYMGALSAIDDNSITVDRFELKGNYPNPFNPTTKIRFTNDRNSNVKVTVYALTGEKVATIMNSQLMLVHMMLVGMVEIQMVKLFQLECICMISNRMEEDCKVKCYS